MMRRGKPVLSLWIICDESTSWARGMGVGKRHNSTGWQWICLVSWTVFWLAGLDMNGKKSWSRALSGVWWHMPLKLGLYRKLVWESYRDVWDLAVETYGKVQVDRPNDYRWSFGSCKVNIRADGNDKEKETPVDWTCCKRWEPLANNSVRMDERKVAQEMVDDIRNGSTYAEMKSRGENREERKVASWETCLRQSTYKDRPIYQFFFR